MGIDISAKLLYGLPYDDIPEDILDEVNELLDNGELDYASPYYDAPRDRWIVGVECDLWGDTLQNAERELSVVAGSIPEIIRNSELGFYVTPHVW